MKLLIAVAFALVAAGAGLAQSAPANGPPPAAQPTGPPSQGVFLSPSGEPFRPTASAPDPLKTWFEQVDSRHQGFIDREAFRADAARFFKKLDENGDGIIDGFEVADYEHKLVPELAEEAEARAAAMERGGGSNSGQSGQGQGSGRPGGGRHRGGGAAASTQDSGAGRPSQGRPPVSRISQLIGEREPVSGADFNLDSHITLDEWMRATDQRFDILDEHKDGKLTLEELRARFKPLPKSR